MAEINGYEALPGKGVTNMLHGEVVRMFLGPDHLLQVNMAHFQETYRRYYFRDIQSIVVQRNKGRLIRNIVLVILICITLLLILSVDATGGKITISAVTGLLVILGIINNALGPTAHTYIRTAVKAERLPSLQRERLANGFIAKVRPRIEDAQREMARKIMEEDGEIGSGANPATEYVLSVVPQKEAIYSAPVSAPHPLRHYSGRAHFFLFFFLLINAVHSMLSLHFGDSQLLEFWGGLNFIGFIGLGIWAVIRQRHSDLDMRIKRLPVVIFIYFFAITIIAGGFSFFYAIFNASAGTEVNQLLIKRSPFWSLSSQIDAVFSTAIGGYGLYLLLRSALNPTKTASVRADNDAPDEKAV